MTERRRCVFFDRDGIVNRSPGPGYVERWEDFHLLEEFVVALCVAKEKGYDAVIVTNQRGVALGRMTKETVDELHEKLQQELRRRNLALLDIFVCMHDRHEGCACRKPNPGMILDAIERYDLDATQSWMVGDSETDVQAGQRAGCRTVRVAPRDEQTSADVHLFSMAELAPFLESRL